MTLIEKQLKYRLHHQVKQIKTIEDQGEKKKKKQFKIKDQLKQLKNMAMMMKILQLKQKEIFNELVDERREKITDLDKKKVNSDDLTYRYKGYTADVNFDKFDNTSDIIDKTRDVKTDLTDVKNNQEKFKSYLGEKKIKRAKKHSVQY